MNDLWVKQKVLMVVKTYPTPSTKYKETVCTAGVTQDGKWIRLYPIRFRFLKDDQQFKKFSWIEVDTIKPKDDNRPESYKVNGQSIKILNHLDSQKYIDERKRYMLPLVRQSLEEIYDLHESDKYSLGIFKPKIVQDLCITQTEKEWTQKQKLYLCQMSFFEDENKKKVLEKIPWEFRFKFLCNDNRCKGHNIIITDWEIYQTLRSYTRKYGTEKVALEKLKEAWLGKFNDLNKDSYFIVGTVHRYKKFIIIGYFTCPHEEYEQVCLI